MSESDSEDVNDEMDEEAQDSGSNGEESQVESDEEENGNSDDGGDAAVNDGHKDEDDITFKKLVSELGDDCMMI